MASNVAISFDLMTIYFSQLSALPRLTPILQLILDDAEENQSEDDDDDNDVNNSHTSHSNSNQKQTSSTAPAPASKKLKVSKNGE